MRILVTGATGFVGRALVPALLKSGHSVRLLVHRIVPLPTHPNLEYVLHDLSTPLTDETEHFEVDAIMHLAQANVDLPAEAAYLYRVNTQSTVELLNFGRRAGIQKFIFASTGDVYRPKYGLCSEDDPVGSSTLYGVSKVCSEFLCSCFDEFFGVCILRLFHPYGPGQVDRLIPRIAANIRVGKPIALNAGGYPLVSPLFISDVVRCFEIALHLSEQNTTINLAGDEVVSIRSLACEIGVALDREVQFQETQRKSRDLAGSNQRMRRLLHVEPRVSLSEGLALSFPRIVEPNHRI